MASLHAPTAPSSPRSIKSLSSGLRSAEQLAGTARLTLSEKALFAVVLGGAAVALVFTFVLEVQLLVQAQQDPTTSVSYENYDDELYPRFAVVVCPHYVNAKSTAEFSSTPRLRVYRTVAGLRYFNTYGVVMSEGDRLGAGGEMFFNGSFTRGDASTIHRTVQPSPGVTADTSWTYPEPVTGRLFSGAAVGCVAFTPTVSRRVTVDTANDLQKLWNEEQPEGIALLTVGQDCTICRNGVCIPEQECEGSNALLVAAVSLEGTRATSMAANLTTAVDVSIAETETIEGDEYGILGLEASVTQYPSVASMLSLCLSCDEQEVEYTHTVRFQPWGNLRKRERVTGDVDVTGNKSSVAQLYLTPSMSSSRIRVLSETVDRTPWTVLSNCSGLLSIIIMFVAALFPFERADGTPEPAMVRVLNHVVRNAFARPRCWGGRSPEFDEEHNVMPAPTTVELRAASPVVAAPDSTSEKPGRALTAAAVPMPLPTPPAARHDPVRRSPAPAVTKARTGFRASIDVADGGTFASAPALAGFLHKRSSDLVSRWQRRWFECRGHYLLYWNDVPARHEGGGGDEAPLAAINLERAMDVAFKGSGVLEITLEDPGADAPRRILRLRADHDKDAVAWERGLSARIASTM